MPPPGALRTRANCCKCQKFQPVDELTQSQRGRMIALARSGMQGVERQWSTVTGHGGKRSKAPASDRRAMANDSANQLKWREIQADVVMMVTWKAVEIEEFLRAKGAHPVLSCLRSLGSGSCRRRNLGPWWSEKEILSIFSGPGCLLFFPRIGDKPSR